MTRSAKDILKKWPKIPVLIERLALKQDDLSAQIPSMIEENDSQNYDLILFKALESKRMNLELVQTIEELLAYSKDRLNDICKLEELVRSAQKENDQI